MKALLLIASLLFLNNGFSSEREISYNKIMCQNESGSLSVIIERNKFGRLSEVELQFNEEGGNESVHQLADIFSDIVDGQPSLEALLLTTSDEGPASLEVGEDFLSLRPDNAFGLTTSRGTGFYNNEKLNCVFAVLFE